jgi:hypothetical protein
MTASEFLVLYPEFSDTSVYTTETIEARIADAAMEISEDKWALRYEKGLSALTAHFLSFRQVGLAGGGTTRADVVAFGGEGIKVEYADRYQSNRTDIYDKTPYGQEFKRLREIVAYMQPRQFISYD